MKKGPIYALFIIGIILLPITFLTFSYPYIFNSSHGAIEVNWANPTGLKLNDVTKGDKIEISYGSEINVSMYMLTREEANEFRSPSFYKEPLPEPLISGKNATVELEIEENGDYELLFLPDEPSRTFDVDYDLKRDLKGEKAIYFLSGIGLLLTSLILIVLGSVLIKRVDKEVMQK